MRTRRPLTSSLRPTTSVSTERGSHTSGSRRRKSARNESEDTFTASPNAILMSEVLRTSMRATTRSSSSTHNRPVRRRITPSQSTSASPGRAEKSKATAQRPSTTSRATATKR